MPYAYVDLADLADLDDDDLISELEYRGYKIAKSKIESDLEDVIWHFKNNRLKEALIELERIEPELYGISNHIKE